MKQVRITSICDIQVGKTPSRSNPSYWGSGSLWLSIADMNQGSVLETTKETITEKAINNCNCKIVPKNTVLFSFKLSIGKVGITNVPMYTNEAIAAFIIKDHSKLNTKFLSYVLKSVDYSIGSNKAVMGKTLNKEQLKKIEIPLPPLEDQKRIVRLLDEANTLRQKRKQAVALLDDYLKSVFLEMFGDPVKNPKGWKMKKLGEVSESRLGKMRDKQYITGNYLKSYLGNSNVKWFCFDFSDLLEMDFNEREKITYSLNYGDLLVCEGGEVGRCAIWKDGQKDCFFQKALHRVRTNRSLIIPEYLQWVLWFYSKGNAFKESRSQATIAHLTGIKLKRLPIPVAKLDLQNKFAEISQKTESLKKKMLAQSEEMENQFQALMQKAFKGDL